jgi:hypothetical protein
MILSSEIFFRGDVIDLSFVCNYGQIDILLEQVETNLINTMFDEVGEIEGGTEYTELIEVLKYFAFVEMMFLIVNDFNGSYTKSYYANVLSQNPTLANEMTTNRIQIAKNYAYVSCQKFDFEGWKLNESYLKITNFV